MQVRSGIDLKQIPRVAERWLATGLDLALPPVCCFCRHVCQPVQTHPGICRACLATLPLRFGADRLLCKPDACVAGEKQQAAVMLCAAFYRSPVREALIRLKFADAPEVSVALGSLLTPLVRQVRPPPTALAAVPLHQERLKERGYNQSALLTAQVCRQLGLADLSSGLLRQRKTMRQSELTDRVARWANMADAFRLHRYTWQGWLNERAAGRSPETEHILLIDDVLTTGATLAAAAQPLLQAGFRVSCLVVASAQGRARQHGVAAGDPS